MNTNTTTTENVTRHVAARVKQVQDEAQAAITAANARVAFYAEGTKNLLELLPALTKVLRKYSIKLNGVQHIHMTFGTETATTAPSGATKLRVDLDASSDRSYASQDGASKFCRRVEADVKGLGVALNLNQHSFVKFGRHDYENVLATIWL